MDKYFFLLNHNVWTCNYLKSQCMDKCFKKITVYGQIFSLLKHSVWTIFFIIMYGQIIMLICTHVQYGRHNVASNWRKIHSVLTHARNVKLHNVPLVRPSVRPSVRVKISKTVNNNCTKSHTPLLYSNALWTTTFFSIKNGRLMANFWRKFVRKSKITFFTYKS